MSDYENWPCIECGNTVRVMKPIHEIPPNIKCKECKDKEEPRINDDYRYCRW